MSATRRAVVGAVADRVPAARGRPVRVAVDGADGAGKTWFAGELGEELRARGRTVVRAGVDDFHRPRAERYRRGRGSAVGFWLDSYDYDRFRDELLAGFAEVGDRRYRTAVHDVVTDTAVDGPWCTAPDDAVLLVDGIFLLRDELLPWWDLTVRLEVDAATRFARMAVRDGSPPDPADPANTRYREGQRLYLAACDPAARAHVVIDNGDLAHPVVVRSTASTSVDTAERVNLD